MVTETSYSFVLWAVPRFRRASPYAVEPRQSLAAVEGARDNPPAPKRAVEQELREVGACLSTAY